MKKGIYFLKNGLISYADPLSAGHEQEWQSFVEGASILMPDVISSIMPDTISDTTPGAQNFSEQRSFFLPDNALPAPLYICGAVESSFDVAFHLTQKEMFEDFSSVLVASQKSGRGQLRRHWHSPEGNIYGTLRLPKEYPFNTEAAAPILGAIIAQSLEGQGFCVKIKWPNDIIQFEGEKAYKVAGMLLEERNNVLMLGLGINICHAPEFLREGAAFPASTLKYTDKENLFFKDLGRISQEKNLQDVQNTSPCLFSKSLWGIWSKLVRDIFLCYTNNVSSDDITSINWYDLVKSYMAFLGMNVNVEHALFDDNSHDEFFSGKLLGIGHRGELLVRSSVGVRSIVGGSLSLAKS